MAGGTSNFQTEVFVAGEGAESRAEIKVKQTAAQEAAEVAYAAESDGEMAAALATTQVGFLGGGGIFNGEGDTGVGVGVG